MTAVDRYDVLISGCGLAGSSLAILLAREGYRVGALDASRFPRDKLCGEYLSAEGVEVLGRLGVMDRITDAGAHPITRVRLTTPRGRAVDARVIDSDVTPGLGLSRLLLDETLVDTARRAGAIVHESCRAVEPVVEAGRVVGVVARGEGGQRLRLDAKVVVAADGRHSRLVAATGVTRLISRGRPGHFGLKRHLKLADAEEHPGSTVALHTLAGGYVGSCHVDGGLVNLCGLLPEAMASSFRGDLDRLAKAEFAANPELARLWAEAEPVSDWKTVAGVRVERSVPTVPGILYVGDCAGTVDPLGGQGQTMALRGAELAVAFVRRAVEAGVADRGLQAEYAETWRRRFRRRIDRCRAIHHALVRPWSIDLLSTIGALGGALVARGYHATRDRSA